MIVGEIGLQLKMTPTGIPGGSLTGWAVTLKMRRPDQSVSSYSMVVANDGLSASYTTTGTECPIEGTYQIQFIAVAGGQTLKAPIANLVIKPTL